VKINLKTVYCGYTDTSLWFGDEAQVVRKNKDGRPATCEISNIVNGRSSLT
jgi:hypothetical protein